MRRWTRCGSVGEKKLLVSERTERLELPVAGRFEMRHQHRIASAAGSNTEPARARPMRCPERITNLTQPCRRKPPRGVGVSDPIFEGASKHLGGQPQIIFPCV